MLCFYDGGLTKNGSEELGIEPATYQLHHDTLFNEHLKQ